jgi:hypothetical protein
MIWGMPRLIFAASGTLVLLTHLALFSHRKFSRPKDTDYNAGYNNEKAAGTGV